MSTTRGAIVLDVNAEEEGGEGERAETRHADTAAWEYRTDAAGPQAPLSSRVNAVGRVRARGMNIGIECK